MANTKLPAILIAAAVLSASAQAQVIFTNATSQFPASNTGFTENVDFGDVDGDGDFDAVLAEGGDAGDDQNNIWINRGNEPGGTIGWFVDRTSTQFPAVLDQSRDIEFVDFDMDGDLDIYVSNTSQISNQSNRWWVNMGGAQGGTQGFYVDQSSTRWVGLGQSGSSIAPSQVLAGTGFIDFSCDCDFGDLDNDGDSDLVHSSYGGAFGGNVPTRLFLNNGTGFFTEFNPSGFQLGGQQINNGNPGIWAQGTQSANTTNATGANCDIASSALDIDVGDIDGDFDLDILHGARQEQPRLFKNLLETGSLAFRDVTGASFPANYSNGNGHYEQEMGDCDNDGDIDIYGLNWQASTGFNDITLRNDGAGTYSNLQVLAGSSADDNEGDFLDYDNDGDLDIYVANFSGQDKLYRNDFTGTGNFSHTNMPTLMPSASRTALDADCSDLDQDGDTDVMVSNDGDQAEYYFINTLNTPDTFAPYIPKLEQAPNRNAGLPPTVVRAHVYDNAAYYVTWYHNVQLEYRVVPAAFQSVAMVSSEGQVFRGKIPGALAGTIEYRVRATDRHGNVGVSATKSFVATGNCTPPVSYCTPGTTTNGCNATLSATGTPSATATSGFTLSVSNVEGQRQGLIFYSINGRNAAVWAIGNTSFLCVKAPTQRLPTLTSGGTNNSCTGSFSIDWQAWMATHPSALGQPLTTGQLFQAQCWFRDPPAPGTTNLSQGVEWQLCP
ncbi:MAG: VCBS repeat-containing protein [Planctomycetaceae bacterium]|nr:VCBS repeat-containing protein [Planctomycetaceae bacterium]